MKNNLTLNIFRMVSLLVILAGAGGSLFFTLYTGRNNKSVLLIALFAIWVLSPFAALLAANVVSKRWPSFRRFTLYGLALGITLGSLVGYSGALSIPGSKPAAVFLFVPLLSWVIMLIVILMTVKRSRKTDRI
jgi:hypothetical protein